MIATIYDKEDLNRDGVVNFFDYAKFAANLQGTGPAPAGDINEDGIVDYKDLEALAKNWLARDPEKRRPCCK